MARIEQHPKVILSQEEIDILMKTQRILIELGTSDNGGEIFCVCDNDESEWYWMDYFLEKLIKISEVE